MDELKIANLYQELMLRKRKVDLELKFKGPNLTINNLATQLHAKINNNNIGGLERTRGGKYNSQVVKGAMYVCHTETFT
jgi:hypothetical protein